MHDLLVFIPYLGSPNYGKYSEEILVDYFEYHNIKYFFLKIDDPKINNKNAHASWLKLISHRYIDFDGFILCWDLDLLPDNRDVTFIEDIDFNKINICYDTSVILKMNKFNANFYYNGGLIGIPKGERSFVESVYETYAPGSRPSYEQYYLNDEIQINEKNINILPTYLNSLYYPYSSIGNDLFIKAKYKHYTGGIGKASNKIELIKKHYLNYFKLNLSNDKRNQPVNYAVNIKNNPNPKDVRFFKIRK